MNPTPSKPTFDQEVRRYAYDQVMQTGVAPTIAATASALASTPAEIRAAFQRLAETRMLVLQRDTGEILMANPFSAVPTPFLAQVDGRSYYGNCIWDVLGIPAMLGRDALIQTSCGDCGTAMPLRVINGTLEPAAGLVHFAVPAARWWADIAFS